MSDTIKYEKEILKILDQKLSQEAHLLREKSQNITLDKLDTLIKDLCKELFSKSYLYVDLHEFIKTLDN